VKKLAALIILLALATPSAAAAPALGLITGMENGTYHRFGVDLKRLVKADGIDVNVYPSRGSLDNLAALHGRPGIHMGIVQSDVLDFIAGVEGSPLLAQIGRRLRVVFPLYTEDVHLVARRDIGVFEQLEGKRVAIGPEGSGPHLTARLMFKLADVHPAELVTMDHAQAVARLKTGEIDAMIYVAAAPVNLLRDGFTAADGVGLVPIVSKSILEAYDPVELAANTYPWQGGPVATVAVRAVLISSDLEGAACENLGRFAQHLLAGMDRLARQGHPMWRRVDLGYELKGWTRSECVGKHIDSTGAVQASPSHGR
jgi:TRAP transporter TAXI family solute receptor